VFEALTCRCDQGWFAHAPRSEPESLVCERCGQSYDIRDGVVRAVEGDQYAASFSYQWTVHRTTQLDSEFGEHSSARTFREKTGWGPEDVMGRRVLDVGCGMGRFADVVLRWGGEVYATDLSFAIDAAHANLGDRPGFHAVQASVFDLPFRPESFDLIFSLGALDHTPDCEKAFKALPRLLRPEGQIAIWVYSAHTYPRDGVDERRDRLYRRYTTRMSPRALHRLCRVLCSVRMKHRGFWHMALPGFLFHAIPRLNWEYPERDPRVLDTFDWYSTMYQSKHTYPEVFRWFREEGLTEVEILDQEVCVRGRKPVGAPRTA
jgi:SAM-dependent methyltransferase